VFASRIKKKKKKKEKKKSTIRSILGDFVHKPAARSKLKKRRPVATHPTGKKERN